MQHSQGVSQQHEACFVFSPPFTPQEFTAPGRHRVPRWRPRWVSPVGGAGAGRVSIAAVSHRGTSWSEAASPGAASRDAPLGKAAEGGRPREEEEAEQR